MAHRGGGHVILLLAIAVSLCLAATRSEAKLTVGFYYSSCPKAEYIVRKEVTKGVSANPGNAPGLLRMHFHDCFVRGCDGSVLIDSTSGNSAEKDGIPNQTLRGFEVVDKAKKKLEKVCPGTVSCADILAFAARDSVVLSGGLSYQVPAGRRDGRISKINDTADLPPPFLNQSLLLPFFTKKGLNQDDLVTLSGAHTIGRAHCGAFANRLYNFSSTASTDPTLDASYAAQLKKQCPPGSNNVVPMDPPSPTLFDVSYYKNILSSRGLFTSDQTLLTDSGLTADLVKQYAYDYNLFQKKFAAAVTKMGQIGVLTGKNGEIRANCRVIN